MQKPKLKSLSKLKLLVKPLAVLALLVATFAFVHEIPNLQRAWLRNKVSSHVFEIRGAKNGGGGTGFQVEAPSGTVYIVTNSHVCEHTSKDKNFVLVQKGEHLMKRLVLEVSEEADLCLIEAWPGMSGLKLGTSLDVGDLAIAIGHPLLGPTTLTSGEVTSIETVTVLHHVMRNPNDGSCSLPKNEIRKRPIVFMGIFLGNAYLCLNNEQDALNTNIVIYPGSSGSPLVNKWGNVVGVMFASDQRTNWGSAVNLQHLKDFLSDF